MPISAENRARYPKDWRLISLEVREAAGWRCEGSPAYPDCRAVNGEPHPVTLSRVVLTVAHLDHTPENCDRANLKAMCQRCHLTYDAKHHAANARRTLAARKASGDLFSDPAGTTDLSGGLARYGQHRNEPIPSSNLAGGKR